LVKFNFIISPLTTSDLQSILPIGSLKNRKMKAP
jgi:hypothetical protein